MFLAEGGLLNPTLFESRFVFVKKERKDSYLMSHEFFVGLSVRFLSKKSVFGLLIVIMEFLKSGGASENV